MQLKASNWLYENVDENSLDDTSRHIIETVSKMTSTMLGKVTTDEVSSYQSYTVRQLNSKQSSLPDSEHYKLVDVKEDALSNKLKYLDVLCFPTHYPTQKFGEWHPRQHKISPSKFVKFRQMNKDRPFCKDNHYVFSLLWQKEMRELESGVFNLLKGTREHAIPVGEVC